MCFSSFDRASTIECSSLRLSAGRQQRDTEREEFNIPIRVLGNLSCLTKKFCQNYGTSFMQSVIKERRASGEIQRASSLL